MRCGTRRQTMVARRSRECSRRPFQRSSSPCLRFKVSTSTEKGTGHSKMCGCSRVTTRTCDWKRNVEPHTHPPRRNCCSLRPRGRGRKGQLRAGRPSVLSSNVDLVHVSDKASALYRFLRSSAVLITPTYAPLPTALGRFQWVYAVD